MITQPPLTAAHSDAATPGPDAAMQVTPEHLRYLVGSFNVSPNGVLLFDSDERLILVNPQARSFLTGRGPQLVVGVQFAVLFPHWPLTSGVRLADTRLLQITRHPVATGGSMVLVVDETDQRRSEQRMANVIEGAEVGTWEWDVASGLNRVNDRWLLMLGYSRAELDPLTIDTWRGLMHPGDTARVEQRFVDMVRQHERQLEASFRLRHAEGHYIWVQSRGRVMRWAPDGQPALMAGVHIDVTELRAVERRLEDVVQGAQIATWQMDKRRNRNSIDARWAEMLGYQLADLEPMTIDDWHRFVHPEDLAAMMGEQTRWLDAGMTQFSRELRLRHRDGDWVWVLSAGRVTDWDAAGDPAVISGMHIDISRRKALEAALQTERNFLAALMETSMSGIVALDAAGLIVFVNRAAEVVLGRPMSSLIGTPCGAPDWQMTHVDGTPMAHGDAPSVRAAVSGQVQLGLRMGLSWPDGTKRMLSINAAPMRMPGIAADVVCSLTDITDAVQAEADLRAAMERAAAASRAKSEFLANMSHEIRTPLNGVLGMAQVLGTTLTTPDQKAMLATIQSSGTLLLSIINDILDLAKIESGKATLEDEPFFPAELAQRVEAIHTLAAQAKGVDLVVMTDTGALLPRRGDAQRVLQIMHNLAGNAVKFTEAGAVRLTVTGRAAGPLVLEVADTGIGMTPEQVSQVFEDFAQADGTISRRFGGTGLGLPIVRRLVTQMGGTITLASELGRGSQVRVELPLPMAANKPPQRPPRVRKLAGTGTLHALVAEDNATNRLILKAMLAQLGITAVLVEDGDEAVDQWQPGMFDVLLLDISMPRKDGVQALAAIKAKAAAAGGVCPPALAVTANAMTHQFAEYRSLGFGDCVAKPLRLDDLSRAIAGVMTAPAAGMA